MTTEATLETIKVGVRFTVKSGKVYEVDALGGSFSEPVIGNSGQLTFFARNIRDGSKFGPFRRFYAKSVVEIF